jgi:hypothetical protein
MYLGQSRVRVDRDIPKCAHGRERDLLKMPVLPRPFVLALPMLVKRPSP